MKILTYGDILEGGNSIFTTIARLDEDTLTVQFKGAVRSNNPYKSLAYYIEDLENKLKENLINSTIIDMTELSFCNSNGFYVLMDIIEIIYDHTKGNVIVKRLKHDDWHQETLPILLNIDEEAIFKRTSLEDALDL